MSAVPIWSHLKPARRAQGKTAEAVADYMKIGTDMIYRFESGRSDMTISQLQRYCEAINVQIGELFPSPTPRSREIQPMLAALEGIEPAERPAIIEKAARDIQWQNAMIAARVAREVAGRESHPAVTPQVSSRQTLDEGINPVTQR